MARTGSRNTKFIFVTGGVVSSLGKGLAAASMGALLESRGTSEVQFKSVPQGAATTVWAGVVADADEQRPQHEIAREVERARLKLDQAHIRLVLAHARGHCTVAVTVVEEHPADLAHIISQIPTKSIQAVINSLDTETAGEAIHELAPELRSRVISQLDSEQASDILEEMDPDEAADVLGDLPQEKAQELLGLMDEEEAEDIQELMEHEEDTAGGLMNSEFLFISASLTAEEALQQVKLLAPDVETVYYIYIVEPDETLSGVVSLKDLLINPPHTPISELMATNLKTVNIESSPEDILEIIAKYNLIAVPVLDKEAKIAGIVTVDDILELFLPYALRRKRHRHH